jgi:DNA-binding GntR family transcriptional regulator
VLKIAAPVQLIEQVYETILNAICDGTFPPNQRITQEQIAADLGVSRQPVVQAFHLLKKQGFITDAGRKGVMVTPLEVDKLLWLYQIRAVLDGLAARDAAKKMGLTFDNSVAETGRALIIEGQTLQGDGSVSALIDADMRFHQYIYTISGNPFIAETAGIHWHHIRRVMGLMLSADAHRKARIWAEHHAIFEAICVGDAVNAEQLAKAHAEMAAQYLADSLRKNQVGDQQHVLAGVHTC